MIIQQRVMAARFAEKARKNPDFVKELGISIYYTEKGGINDEKGGADRRNETDRDTDVEGDYIH